MATIPDSVQATITAGWTGAGGAEPTYYVSEDFRTDPPLGKDGIWIPTVTLKTKIQGVNDTYSNKLHTLEVIVNTQTDEDRLKEIADEVERVLNATAITGATYQKVIDRKSNVGQYKGIWVYQEILVVDIREQLASSASAYGGTAPSLTQAQLEDLLMYGSANAAWVPCAFEGGNVQADYEINVTGTITNTGAGAMGLIFTLPYPPTKGSLKLYVSGTEVGLDDADASNFVTAVYVLGITFDTQAVIDVVGTNLTTIAAHQDTFTAVDCSSYDKVIVNVECTNPNAGNLDISYVTIRCYYA